MQIYFFERLIAHTIFLLKYRRLVVTLYSVYDCSNLAK